jgi:hypothetical protein
MVAVEEESAEGGMVDMVASWFLMGFMVGEKGSCVVRLRADRAASAG